MYMSTKFWLWLIGLLGLASAIAIMYEYGGVVGIIQAMYQENIMDIVKISILIAIILCAVYYIGRLSGLLSNLI